MFPVRDRRIFYEVLCFCKSKLLLGVLLASAPGTQQYWTGRWVGREETWATLMWHQAQHALAVCPGSQEANCVLGCIKHSIASHTKEMFLILFKLHLLFWAPQYKKDIKVFESVQGNKKWVTGLQGTSCEAEAEDTWIVWSGWGWEATLLLPAAPEGGEAEGGTGLCVWQLMTGWEPHRAATEEVLTGTKGKISLPCGWSNMGKFPKEVADALCL